MDERVKGQKGVNVNERVYRSVILGLVINVEGI